MLYEYTSVCNKTHGISIYVCQIKRKKSVSGLKVLRLRVFQARIKDPEMCFRTDSIFGYLYSYPSGKAQVYR
jgi:hypothetical protein